MLFKNVKIVTPHKIINGSIKINNDIIEKIYNHNNFSDGIDLKQALVIPGFIDLQINGGFGVDFNNCDKEKIAFFVENILKTGTTQILATILTSSISKIIDNIKLFSKFINLNKTSVIYGIHLEGPFINSKKKGAHNLKFICKPDLKIIKKIINVSKNNLKIITMATENSSIEITKLLTKNQINVSSGHSCATYKNIKNHEKAGLSLCTHLFNAMDPLLTKHPLSLSNRHLVSKKITTCLIPDNHHVDSKIIKMVYQIKKANNVILVSDAIPLLGLKNSTGKLDLINIFSENGIAYVQNTKTLAGSMISMFDCFNNILDFTNCTIFEAVQMTSLNQAKILKIDKKYGSIEIGKKADLVFIKHKKIISVIKNGKIIL